MSEVNPFSSEESGKGDSNIFLDLNKPDEDTGVPDVAPSAITDGRGGGSAFSQKSTEPSKFNGQVMLAGLVFTIGVGAIYAMRYIGMQAGIKESVTMVEYTASTTTPDFVKRFDTIMTDLEEVSISVRFSEDTDLPDTPFTMETPDDPVEALIQPLNNKVDQNASRARLAMQRAEAARLERQAKEAEYESLAAGLKLQSVIGGSRPVARISDEPVGVGMTVADTFKVISIKGTVVILEVEGIKFELGLGDGAKRIN